MVRKCIPVPFDKSEIKKFNDITCESLIIVTATPKAIYTIHIQIILHIDYIWVISQV